MKIEVTASTKWYGCNESLVIDLDELGYTEEAWDNMSETERQDEILQIAFDAIGFSFSYDYVSVQNFLKVPDETSLDS